MHVVEQIHQPLHQRCEQRFQWETGLHQLLDTSHYCGVAGEHFTLRRHYVRDERVTPTLLLKEDNASVTSAKILVIFILNANDHFLDKYTYYVHY